MSNPENPTKIPEFYCNVCNLLTCHKNDYKKHIKTKKHLNALNGNLKKKISPNNSYINNFYICNICSKEYKSASGLWKHNQICKPTECLEIVKSESTTLEPTVIYDIVKQITESNESIFKSQLNETSKHSLELQKDMFTQIIELLKTNLSTTTNINNGQINNNNNFTHFNLQVYLNETCKNAMTINQFLDYLEPTVEELEATAHLGYVEGISRIIMRGFKNLEEHELPFHCTDLKREHIYLKNPDEEWVEERDEKPLLLRFIKEVARKSFKNLSAWQKQNPNWANYHSKQNDLFNKIVGNSMSGATEEEQQENYEKIMKNIMKNITIDKSKKNSR